MPSRRKLRVDESVPLWYLFGDRYDGYTQPMETQRRPAPLSAPAPVDPQRQAVSRLRVERQALKQASESAELEYARVRQRRFLEPETQPIYLADHDRVEASRREKERLRGRHPRGEAADAPERLNDPGYLRRVEGVSNRSHVVRAMNGELSRKKMDAANAVRLGHADVKNMRDYGREAELADIRMRHMQGLREREMKKLLAVKMKHGVTAGATGSGALALVLDGSDQATEGSQAGAEQQQPPPLMTAFTPGDAGAAVSQILRTISLGELEEQAVKINPAVRAARNGNGVLYITHRYTSIDRRRGKAPARARGARLRLRSPPFPRVDGAPVCVVRRARVSRYDPERAQTTLPGDLGRTASLPSLVSQHVYELDLRSGPKKGHTCVGDRIVGNPTLSVHLPAPVTAQPSTDHSSLSASPSRDQFFSHHSQASVGPSPMPVRPPPAVRQRRRAAQLTREPSSRADRCERCRSSEARASR